MPLISFLGNKVFLSSSIAAVLIFVCMIFSSYRQKESAAYKRWDSECKKYSELLEKENEQAICDFNFELLR